jgi:nanoRNase/pAp phosphatase (c-di-AMP/oligoRNAs hydrolase)
LFASELGNQLCLDYPEAEFSICYADHGDKRKFSLRSVGDFDVSAVAGIFGGGGHRNASGMAVSVSGHEKIQRLSSED